MGGTEIFIWADPEAKKTMFFNIENKSTGFVFAV